MALSERALSIGKPSRRRARLFSKSQEPPQDGIGSPFLPDQFLCRRNFFGRRSYFCRRRYLVGAVFLLALANRKALSEKGWSFRKSPFFCQGGAPFWEALSGKGWSFRKPFFLSGGRAYWKALTEKGSPLREHSWRRARLFESREPPRVGIGTLSFFAGAILLAGADILPAQLLCRRGNFAGAP